MRRTILALLACLPAAPALAQGDSPFTTGPVTGPMTGGSVSALDDFPSPPGGSDIRVNQVTTSAQNETSLAVNPIDPLNWVGVANDYRFGGVETGWYTTLDGGKTWTTSTFGVESGYSFSGDPCVAFDSQGIVNVVCMMYDGPGGVDRVKSFRSIDGGLTWSGGKTIGSVNGYDKPQVEADLSPTSPNRDFLLVAWDHFGAGFGLDNVVVSTSTTQGSSWSVPQVINDTSKMGISPDVAWGPNGEAYVLWADRGVSDVIIDRSLNAGVTWAADKKIADFTHVPDFLPGNSLRVFDIFAVHADQSGGPFSGRIYAAWHTWASGIGSNRADVMVSTSSDQGSTWTAPVKISTDAGLNDQLFPGVVVDRQGNVNVAYYDQRNDPSDHLLWTWVSRSADGGVTWSDTQVSDVGWNDASTEYRFFIGDYIDNEADANGLLHPFWCDGRSGSQDVYTDSFNLQLFTTSNTVSAATGGVVDFQIQIGPNHAGESYLMVASGAGTTPGLTLAGGVHLPLNPDFWTDLSLQFAGSGIFPGSVGTLSATGAASAQMNTLGPFAPVFAGTNLDFTVVTIAGSTATHASPTTRVALVP
jgi:hypothetical protein